MDISTALRVAADEAGGSEILRSALPFIEDVAAVESARAALAAALPTSPDGIGGITLSPGNACSGGCVYCYAKTRFQADPRPTNIDTVRSVLRFIADNAGGGVDRNCSLTIGGGGDPAEHFEVYEEAIAGAENLLMERGIRVPVLISTVDPRFLTPRSIELIAKHQDWITVSVDGDPVTTRLRSVANIPQLLAAFPQVHWAASAVFTRRTVGTIAKNYRYLETVGFEAIQMRPARLSSVHSHALTDESVEIALDQYDTLLRTDESDAVGLLERLTSADYLMRFLSAYLCDMPFEGRCTAGTGSVFVDPSGDMFPCGSTATPSRKLGNLQAIRLMPPEPQDSRLPAACRTCAALLSCGGPCLHEEDLMAAEEADRITNTLCDLRRGLDDRARDFVSNLQSCEPRRLAKLIRAMTH